MKVKPLTLGEFRHFTAALPDDTVLGMDLEDYSLDSTGVTFVMGERALFLSNAADDIPYNEEAIGPYQQCGVFFDPADRAPEDEDDDDEEEEEVPLGIGAAHEEPSCEETIKC